jgi:hypothetical protein
MMPVGDDIFIVISGHHPHKGKGGRISQARAHITKAYHRAEKEKRRVLKASSDKSRALQVFGNCSISRELCNPLPTVGKYSLLDPNVFAAETVRRLDKCERASILWLGKGGK